MKASTKLLIFSILYCLLFVVTTYPFTVFKVSYTVITFAGVWFAGAWYENAYQWERFEGLDSPLKKLTDWASMLPNEPVEGDLLPPLGSTVLIHLGRSDQWVPHTVVGYYVWGDRKCDPHLHRVFVRVRDADGFLNARLLSDIRPVPKFKDPTP